MKTALHSALTICILGLLLVGCSSEPNPISYGMDGCHYCKMTIVDKQHAAQIVTQKGKNYKYDAIECMVNDLNRREEGSIAVYLVADYNQPGSMMDATQSHFIISKAIPSPMGEFLSAFDKEMIAKEKIDMLGGDYFTWDQLQEEFE